MSSSFYTRWTGCNPANSPRALGDATRPAPVWTSRERTHRGYEWAGKMYEVRISNIARDMTDHDASAPLTADGHTIALYRFDEGSGEPVVMLHGNPTWSFLYRHLIDSLRGSHRVVVPDHIGCGFSDKPDDSEYSYTLSSRVDDLELLLDHL